MPTPMPVPPQPVRTLARRRGALIGVGLALVALGALAFLFVSARMNETTEVIAVVSDLERGSVIGAADVAVASMVADPRLASLPADRIEDVIGLRASTDLVAGTLLTEASLAAEVVPGDGQTVVGVALTPAQVPGEPLLAGDKVLIVDTPAAGEAPPSETPTAIEATVLQTHSRAEAEQVVVDVVVPREDALDLAARVATGRIAVVLESRER
ncbi:MAG: SAF domain-containing protein [Acidimicrobiales bacterium]